MLLDKKKYQIVVSLNQEPAHNSVQKRGFKFSGPITIRISEADGTYDHQVRSLRLLLLSFIVLIRGIVVAWFCIVLVTVCG